MRSMRRQFKSRSSERGVGLVQVMVLAGLLSTTTVVFVQMSKDITKKSKSITTSSQIDLVHNQIVRTLQDPESCIATLGGKTFPTVNLTNYTSTGSAIPAIKLADGSWLTGVGKDKCATNNRKSAGSSPCNYGIGTDSVVQVAQARLGTLPAGLALPAESRYKAYRGVPALFIQYKKGVASKAGLTDAQIKALHQKSQYGSLTDLKIIPIHADTTGGTIQGCTAVPSALTQEFCTNALGGTWDNITQKCDSIEVTEKDSAPTTVAITATGDMQVTENLEVGGNGAVTGNLTVTDYTKASSFSTEPLSSSAGQVNANELCLNGNCIGPDWSRAEGSTRLCDPSEYQYGTNANGTPQCRTIPAGACGPGAYVWQVNPDGSLVCKVLVILKNFACPAGTAVREANIRTGAVTCVSLVQTGCSGWVYGSYVGTTTGTTTGRGSSTVVGSPKLMRGAGIQTANGSQSSITYSSGVIRVYASHCSAVLQ